MFPVIASARAGLLSFWTPMIIMDDKERVCIFIDGSNFYHCLGKDVGDMDIDFQKLSRNLCGSNTTNGNIGTASPRINTVEGSRYLTIITPEGRRRTIDKLYRSLYAYFDR